MAPDRRALFEAAYGALMTRNAPAQPARRPIPPAGVDQTPNTLPSSGLADGGEPAPRARS